LRSRAVAIGADKQRSNVIPYGVDSERFKPSADARARGRALLRVADNVPVVVAVGRLVKKKGFEYLIDAAAAVKAHLPQFRVAIAGSGDLDTSLRARAQAAGIGDSVQFLGVVSHEVVPLLLAAADVVVAPSVHDDAGNVDGLPNTVMEMMASGTPLVATPAGGIGAVAIHGVTALVVPERDVPALAIAIESLLRDRSAAMLIGTQAREFVCRHHSWARVAEDFEAVYQRC
jgi:glycosyltransferase involved in cell wall biosynthesis